MRKLTALSLAFFLCVSAAHAAQINALVVTDSGTYVPGDTVNWEVYAWASQGDNRGVSLLALSLFEDDDQVMQAADTEMYLAVVLQLENTTYGAVNQFILEGAGTPKPAGGELADMNVRMNVGSRVFDVGQDDGSAPLPLYAQGSFVLSGDATPGLHTLSVVINGANYWADTSSDQPNGFENSSLTAAEYEVIPEPATLLLTGLGLGGLAIFRRRRR